ncbi:hypothetical protein D3C76_1575820 [compost metagenome]
MGAVGHYQGVSCRHRRVVHHRDTDTQIVDVAGGTIAGGHGERVFAAEVGGGQVADIGGQRCVDLGERSAEGEHRGVEPLNGGPARDGLRGERAVSDLQRHGQVA